MVDYEYEKDEEYVELTPEDEGEKPEAMEPYDEESDNLVEHFEQSVEGTRFLKKLASYILDDFEREWQAQEEYREKTADNWRLFAGELKPKEEPFKDSANFHIPLSLEHITRVATRATGELFGDWSSVFTVVPNSDNPLDIEIANVLTHHGNWQIREQIPDFQRQIGHRGMLIFFHHGDVAAHSFFDEQRQMNRHEVLTPEDLVVPYTQVSTMPDYSDVPWRCKRVKMYRPELEARKVDPETGRGWMHIDKVLSNEPTEDEEDESKLSRAVKDASALEEPEEKRIKAYEVLWYEGWCTLPLQNKQRFVQVIMDRASSTIMSLFFQEKENWQDLIRYNEQVAELQQYQMAMQAFEAQQMELENQMADVQSAFEAKQVGPLHNEVAQQEAAGALQQMQAAAPQPPEWLAEGSEPEPVQRDPVHLFAHGVCIESLVANLGLSYGRIQADHNRAANVVFNQYIDAAWMNNINSIIVAGGVEFTEGLKIAPGRVNTAVGTTPDNLKNAIMPINAGQPSAGMMEAVKLMTEISQSSIQAPNVLSGESGKSGEPYKGTAARIEQATKQLSVVTSKYANEFVVQVLRNNAYLNSVHLPDEELVQISDPRTQKTMPLKIGKELYRRSYNVSIRSDLRFVPQSDKVMEADALVQMSVKIPYLQGNLGFAYYAIKKSLEARGLTQFVEHLGSPPEPQQVFGKPNPPSPEEQARMAAQARAAQQGAQGAPPGAPPGGPPQGPPGPQPPPNGGMPPGGMQ